MKSADCDKTPMKAKYVIAFFFARSKFIYDGKYGAAITIKT